MCFITAYIGHHRTLRLLPDLNKILFSEFDSRLSIGTIESNMIQLRGDTSRQYISYPEGSSSPVVKFVGEKAELKLKNFYHAFGMQLRNDFLKNAIFPESVVFAYTSTDEGNCAVSGEQLRIFEGRGSIHEKGYTKTVQRRYGLRILFRRFIVRGNTVEGLLISML